MGRSAELRKCHRLRSPSGCSEASSSDPRCPRHSRLGAAVIARARAGTPAGLGWRRGLGRLEMEPPKATPATVVAQTDSPGVLAKARVRVTQRSGFLVLNP